MYAFLDRYFGLKEQNTTIGREIIAGITTFCTLAYSLFLLPSILSETGMDFGSVLVAMILVGVYASFMMGAVANYPFVLAPGITLAAYFTYSVVLGQNIPWREALGIVFLTGILLLFLNLFRIRQLIIRIIPFSLRVATTSGLGLFLALIGLRHAQIIVSHPTTLLALGNLHNPEIIFAACGVVLIGILMVFRVTGAFFLSMLSIWLVSLLLGYISWNGFVSLPSSLTPTFLKLNVKEAFHLSHLSALISFLFVALFDSTGTLLGLAEEAGYMKARQNSSFPRVSRSLMPDTTGTILSSLLGTPPVSVYIESAAGIKVGGKTGLTALTASFLFLSALFFTPFATSIPYYATAPVLIVIGGVIARKMGMIDWEDPTEWIPAFVTFILIPLTYSIANGIAAGYLIYAFSKLLTGKIKEVHWFSWVLAFFFLLKFIFIP